MGKGLTLLGIGSLMSVGLQRKSTGTNGFEEEEMEGFDHEAGKEKMLAFLNNFKESLPFPKKQDAVSGLGDSPSYFINPAQAQPLDMSELDRVSEQIAAMNGGFGGNDDEMEFSSDREY